MVASRTLFRARFSFAPPSVRAAKKLFRRRSRAPLVGGVDVVQPPTRLERLERLCLTVSAHDELRRRGRHARRARPAPRRAPGGAETETGGTSSRPVRIRRSPITRHRSRAARAHRRRHRGRRPGATTRAALASSQGGRTRRVPGRFADRFADQFARSTVLAVPTVVPLERRLRGGEIGVDPALKIPSAMIPVTSHPRTFSSTLCE